MPRWDYYTATTRGALVVAVAMGATLVVDKPKTFA